ncbi:MAG: hypothetical protein ACI4L6_00860 [Candidatus Onthoplasma sp.]
MAKYLKPDCEKGYIEDNEDIIRAKFNNMRHTIFGCMLGDFNESGEYVVSNEIKKELIAMKKFLVDTVDNIDVCVSQLKLDKQISFIVTFEEDKATLTLVEKMSYEANYKLNSGRYSNINEYVLDTLKTSGEVDHSAVYRHWNISQFPGDALDIFSCDEETLAEFFGLASRFKYLLEANATLLKREEEIEEIEANYTLNVLNILKRYPKLEKIVKDELSKFSGDKSNLISPKRPNFAKTINEVLENVIAENIGLLEENEQKEFLQEKRQATMGLNMDISKLISTEKVDKNEMDASKSVFTLKAQKYATLLDSAKEFVKAEKEVKERIQNEENSKVKELARTLGFEKVEQKEDSKIVVPPVAEKQETVQAKVQSGDKKQAGAKKPSASSNKKPAPKKAEKKADNKNKQQNRSDSIGYSIIGKRVHPQQKIKEETTKTETSKVYDGLQTLINKDGNIDVELSYENDVLELEQQNYDAINPKEETLNQQVKRQLETTLPDLSVDESNITM